MSLPIKPFTSLEVTELIHRLNPRKAPGHDQISNKAIKELPVKGIALISSKIPKSGKRHKLRSSLNPKNQYTKLAPIAQLVFYPLCQNYSKSC